MKKICLFLSVAAMAVTACQQAPKTVPVDTEAEKAAVSAFYDKFSSAFRSKDINTFTMSLTDNSLSCGTDPSEFWNKKQISDIWSQMFADTSLRINYSIDSREIRLAADGNSAIIVEQVINPMISSKIVARAVFHVVKTNENWMIDFISWSLVPKNEDLPKLNMALE